MILSQGNCHQLHRLILLNYEISPPKTSVRPDYETDISARYLSVIVPFVKLFALKIVSSRCSLAIRHINRTLSFFPLSQTDLMSLRPGRSFSVPWHRSRGNEKSTPLEHFLYSEKGVEWRLYICNRWMFLFSEFWDPMGTNGRTLWIFNLLMI